MKSQTTRRGFTLIELLIVVAIIAILALIAVPNVLEAQTRAKTSRVRADMRTLATALEAYHVDHNTYPQPSAWLHELTPGVFDYFHMQAYVALSTPVAYIVNGILSDPFVVYGGRAERIDTTYEMGFSNPGDRAMMLDDRLKSSGRMTNRSMYIIQSFGPDFTDDTWLSDFGSYDTAGKIKGHAIVYDPTNGTVSRGDIYRIQALSKFVRHYTVGPG